MDRHRLIHLRRADRAAAKRIALVLTSLLALGAGAGQAAARPTAALGVGDTLVSRTFEVRVDTTAGVFTNAGAVSRPFEARIDTTGGVFTYRSATSRPFEVRNADAYAPFAYHQANSRALHPFVEWTAAAPAVVEEPLAFAFHPPMPNPARGGALLRFDLPVARKVTVDVLDVQGRRVRVLADRVAYAPGRYSLRLEKGRLPAGLYFVRVNAGEFAQTRRLVVLD